MIAARQVSPRVRQRHAPRRAGARAQLVARRRAATLCYAGLTSALPFLLVMAYVALTANLTSLGYKAARTSAQREELRAQSARLEDRIAQLEAPERLAQMASGLAMREPRRYAVVWLPAQAVPVERSHRIALLSTVTDWLKPR